MLSGCSIIRRTPDININENTKGNVATNMILSKNLSNQNFQIQKAIIEIDGESGRQNVIANLKFKVPGTWLVSMRSQAGIEAARFYITEDTILVNDRINKILYRGSPDYLKLKYGITTKYLPAILGDLILENEEQKVHNCINGEFRISEKAINENLEYIIDCKYEKVKGIKAGSNNGSNEIKIGFSRYKKENELIYARDLSIEDSKNQTYIIIRLDKVIPYEDGEISFIPGKYYDEIILK